MAKPKVGIFGLTGCAGDQLVILNCEDELLALVELIDIRSFLMASSAMDEESQLDIAFVEGAVVTEHDEHVLRRVRERSRRLIALGTCAAWGGIAQLQPLSQYVAVDGAITGCPIEKHEFLDAVANLLRGQLPVFPTYAVCVECKANENECLLLNGGAFCCGPVTVAGCHARCPSLGVACIGCRGPVPEANYAAAGAMYADKGYSEHDIKGRLNWFAAGVA
jgi:coenzyme F420-reducing hydrogenase gamma subunit